MKPTTRRSDLSYLIAVAAVGVALAAHWVVHPLVGDRQPFAFFYLAVIVSAWFGVGLTVARRLVELHGARIEARSEGVGKGAEFVVTLDAQPIMGEDAAPAAAHEPARPGGAHVLLVEDNRDTAESLTMLLDLYGHRVRTVYDGVAALDAAGAEAPDVMLVDIGLPGMDGYEVARRIRRDAHLRDVRLIALTGYGRDEDRRQALAAGFDHHLVKPVNPETLNGLVMSVVAEAPEGATGR